MLGEEWVPIVQIPNLLKCLNLLTHIFHFELVERLVGGDATSLYTRLDLMLPLYSEKNISCNIFSTSKWLLHPVQ